MLEKLIPLLIDKDKYFRDFWDKKTIEEKEEFQLFIRNVDDLYPDDDGILQNLLNMSNDIGKRKFASLREKRTSEKFPSLKRIDTICRNRKMQKQFFLEAQTALNMFSQKSLHQIKYSIYGGIKPMESIFKKEFKEKEFYQNDQMLNLWDIIRFRYVVDTYDDLITTANKIWIAFENVIVKARNYYYTAQNKDNSNIYKALHFILLFDKSDFIIEIQLYTKHREIISFFDYHYLYKYNLGIPKDLNKWLKSISKKILINEAQYNLEDFSDNIYCEEEFTPANILYK